MTILAKAPATQIKEAIVAHLQGLCNNFTMPLPLENIRGILDLTGSPRDAYGIVVGCEDTGDWAGNTGRILIGVRPQITVFTHLNDDEDGSLCDSLATDVLNAMPSIKYCLDGWLVAWNGNWTVTDSGMDGSYRQVVLSATIPMQKYNINYNV